jgi:hypothetical protein
MVGRSLIVAALLAYAVVLGCVFWSSEAPAREDRNGNGGGNGASVPREDGAIAQASREGLPLCAVGMQIQRVDWIDKYKQSIDEIADLGADAVKFVVDARQENGSSARIYLDLRMTPTPQQLGELIQHAKSRKLRVILMPIVLLDNPRGDEWRGKIQPNPDYGGWSEWWSSYRNMLNHYAWIAQANGVDVLVVGSELVSTETEEHLPQWHRTIKSVRETFKGRLTYSSNWDHYDHVLFWDRLDLIGMNSYWKFGKERGFPPRPNVDQIIERWGQIQDEKLLEFVRKTGKPLLFLEIGWFSQSNVAYEPWDYTKDQPIDLELQRRLYEGFFRAWWGKPELGGFSIWEWTPGEGGPDDAGYTPENKPAEHVLREWFAKERWEVR